MVGNFHGLYIMYFNLWQLLLQPCCDAAFKSRKAKVYLLHVGLDNRYNLKFLQLRLIFSVYIW